MIDSTVLYAVRHEVPEVTVLVADDQAPIREALRALINATDGFTVVGEASSGEEAIEAASALSPHIVIMDRRMPGIGGLEATRELTARHPQILVVLTSVETLAPEVVTSSGAASFMPKHEISAHRLWDLWRASTSRGVRFRFGST